jgi:chemotaxis protein CheX
MDPKYIQPFVNAVQNVFSTMIDVPLSLQKPFLKNGHEVPYEISGIIGLSGNVSGCVVVSMSHKIAYRLVSALLEEEVSDLDDDTTDAIGEITNMIAGNAKTDFPGEGNSISVPSVVVGKHKVSYPSGIPIVVIPCKTDAGELMVEVAIKEINGN